MTQRRIYLAGPYAARELLAGYGREAEQVGYTLTARWLDGTHEVVPTEKLIEASAEDRQRWALDDLEDVNKSDVLVAFTARAAGQGGTSGGRHVETGYALARHKRVVLVGEPENVFHWLPAVQVVANWHEALVFLAAELVQHEREMPHALASVPS